MNSIVSQSGGGRDEELTKKGFLMKTHVHIIRKDSKKLLVKIPDYHEILALNGSSVPDDVWKEISDLESIRKRTDPVIRLYAEVEPTTFTGLFVFSNWEVCQFTQDQIDEITLSIVTEMVRSTVSDVIDAINKSLPDIPDVMIGISIMNSIRL